MARIISSRIIEDAAQADRRRAIHELHIDDAGREYHVFYLAGERFDVTAALIARVLQLDEQILAREVADAALRVAEREQAVALLALTDDQISKILIVPLEDVPKTRDELDDRVAVVPGVAEEIIHG